MKNKALYLLLAAIALIGCGSSKSLPPLQLSANLPAIIKQPSEKTESKLSEPADTEKTAEQALSSQPKVSNLWEETDLRAVLQDISAQTGVTILYDDSVEGVVTVELKDTPLEQAIKIVLLPNGFVFKKIHDYYLVGSGMPGAPTTLALCDTEVIITNRLAEEAIELLSSDLGSFARADGHSLAVTAPAEIIARIKQDLAVIDARQPLITIEVLVTEVRQGQGESSGIDWSEILTFSSSGAMERKAREGWLATATLKVDLASTIQALAEQGKLNLRANPRVTTMEGKEAEVNVGKEKYMVLGTTPRHLDSPYYYYSRFEAKPITSGVVLKVTPWLCRSEGILLELEVEASDMDESPVEELPIVEKRTIKTQTQVKPGETLVLGGLRQEVSRETERGIPFISRIPVLNFFFKRKRVERYNTELIVFVTPKIINE